MARVTLRQLEQLLLDAADLLGKMDVTAKRNYVCALLLLKRSSDTFDAAWQREYEAELAATGDEESAREVADDPESYTGGQVFVPRAARWAHLIEHTEQLGPLLNEALAQLEKNNPDLDGVLRHIDFNRAPGGERPSDDTLTRLIRTIGHFSLTDDDLEFPGLIGRAYETMLRTFADETGSSAGDHYTPRPVVRLMVRLARPEPHDHVYDPCAGSAGMLVHARQYVADHYPGQAHLVALAGQELSAPQWVNARLNLLFHGIRDVGLRLGDVLTEPRHVTNGVLSTFTKILCNPEFSKTYTQSALDAHAPGRFPYGPTPKQADLMFVQHIVSSLETGGVAVVVMPHGVLFRDGKERVIREALLKADVIEAVIGLGPKIFSGSDIPAALLVLRAPGGKPKHAQGSVLVVNADREFTPGKTKNQLGEEHAEKIVQVYEQWREEPGFSRAVPVADLLADDANLNIRRWVDNTPPPEPHDVSAHLYGGVPRAEVKRLQTLLTPYGLSAEDFFEPLDDGYLALPAEGRDQAAARLEEAARTAEQPVREAFEQWWTVSRSVLDELPSAPSPAAVRQRLLKGFQQALSPYAMLGEFTIVGLLAGWWSDHLEEIGAWAAGGPLRVVQGWQVSIDTIRAPRRGKGGTTQSVSEAQRREALAHPLIAELLEGLLVAFQELDKTDYFQGKKKALSFLEADIYKKLGAVIAALTVDQARDVVLRVLRADLAEGLDARLAAARRDLAEHYIRLAEKYEVSLEQLEKERDEAAAKLAGFLAELGYPRRRH